MFCKRNNEFIKEWMDNYENDFDNESWCESSIHLLSKLINNNIIHNRNNNNIIHNRNNNNIIHNRNNNIIHNRNNNINDSNIYMNNYKILEKEAFYYPSYNETHKIFEGKEEINENLITLHYWNSYSNKYYDEIKDFNWINNNNSMYSKLIKNIM